MSLKEGGGGGGEEEGERSSMHAENYIIQTDGAQLALNRNCTKVLFLKV